MAARYLTLLLALVASPGSAHGVADNHLQIMVIDDRIKMNIVVDMRVLDTADADNDGYASLEELARRSGQIKDWVRRAFDVRDSRGNSGAVVFTDITTDLDRARENGDRADHARILQTLLFPESLSGIRVDLGQVVLEVPELRVTVIDAASGLRYKLLNPRAVRTIVLPARPDTG